MRVLLTGAVRAARGHFRGFASLIRYGCLFLSSLGRGGERRFVGLILGHFCLFVCLSRKLRCHASRRDAGSVSVVSETLEGA